jgi:fluoride ion exporter CrcB/FEX
MDINQIVNTSGVFILGFLTKWLYDANKRDKIRKQKKNGTVK